MIEAKPVDNSFLEGTQWTLSNLQVAQNRQPDKVQIYETSTGQATIRFSNYKQLEKIEEGESEIENESIYMALIIQILIQLNKILIILQINLQKILIIQMKNNIWKNIRHDLGLNKISDEEMKILILEIGVEHILGSKEYNNLLKLKA